MNRFTLHSIGKDVESTSFVSAGTAPDGDSGESRPVGAYGLVADVNPGLRCAAPWAVEFGPFRAGGRRPLPSPERAAFHSPGCNPGSAVNRTTAALKGRHSPQRANRRRILPSMMTITRLIAIASITLLLGAPLFAETVTATATIESVDANARTITVRRKTAQGEKTAKLAVAPQAEILVAGRQRELASLKSGQSITISYDTMAKQITAISVVTAVPPASGDKPSRPHPPDDADVFEGHSYKLFREVMTWHQAKRRCEDLGGHLATVTSEPENDFIVVLAKSGIAKLGQLDGVWLGATDEEKEGDWRWIGGGKLTFSKWGEGQPNNKANEEHYMLLWLPRAVWADQPDRSKEHVAYFVCEWDVAHGSETNPANDKSDAPGTIVSGARTMEDDVKALQGNWLTIAEETNGKTFDKAEVKTRNHRIAIKGHSFTMQRVTFGNFGVYEGKFDIDVGTHAFDFVGKGPNGKLVEFKGIYAVEGDTLKLCYKYVNEKGVTRPTSFKTQREPGVVAVMLVLKRDN
jgi:uncharacterized protein (TIGR03067 family)